MGFYNITIQDIYQWTKYGYASLFITSLQKGSFYVKIEAAKSLAQLKHKPALKYLVKMMVINSPELVLTVIDSMEQIGVTPEVQNTLNEMREINTEALAEMRERLKVDGFGRARDNKKMERLEALRSQLQRGVRRFS